MSRTHVVKWGIRVGLPVVAVVLLATTVRAEPAAASDAERACLATFKNAQEREQSGRLVEASQLLFSCDVETCGMAVWEECAASAARLRATLPSVVPLIVDERGQPRADVLDVRVKMDGALLTARIDGRAVPVDPGTHEFAFDMGGVVVATQKVTILRGQRNRTISVALRTAEKHERTSAPPAVKK